MSGVLITVSAAAAVGALLIALASRMRIPSIVLLLLGGVLVGPEGLGWVEPDALGPGLRVIVGGAVAVILFEGGLSLELTQYRRAPETISRLLTMGVAVTWLGAAAATWYFLDLPPLGALLAGSLVIVTGPTVVSPLLRRISVNDRIHGVLYWEAVLIDAIGVFIAVMCYEWLTGVGGEGGPAIGFAARVAVGGLVGVGAGMLLGLALTYELVPEQHQGIVALSTALLVFAGADAIVHESGILAAIVAGMTVALFEPRQLGRVRQFKLELTELAIGVLFVLLAADLDLADFIAAGAPLIGAVVVTVLVMRPVAVLLSTWGGGFSWREKTFLSWMAPRGIVAASMASLFGLQLAAGGNPYAGTIEAFVFAIIAATVLLQGLSAPWVARLLGVRKPPPRTCLIIAEPPLATRLRDAIVAAGGEARALVPSGVSESIEFVDPVSGTLQADPLDPALPNHPALGNLGSVLAATPDPYLNQLVCHRWREVVGAENTYSWSSRRAGEMGRPVWSWLDPRRVSFRLRDASRELAVMREPAEPDERSVPLLSIGGEGAVELYENEREARQATGVRVVLRQRISSLERMLAGAVYLSSSESLDLTGVVARLLEIAAKEHPGLPVAELLHEAVRRGVMTSDEGGGAALPHASHRIIDQARLYVAVLEDGIEADGQKVDLVFLVLSPAGKSQEHLQALADVARLLSDPVLCRQLRAQRSERGILSVVRTRV